MVSALIHPTAPKAFANSPFLQRADHTPFFWLADTWWYACSQRTAWPNPFQEMVQQRAKEGFTVIQLVMGGLPEIDIFHPDTASLSGMPFHPNYSINEAYFIDVDRKIEYIVSQGLVPCIVGSWGYHWQKLGTTKLKEWWQTLYTRYRHLPVVWCLAGEIDLVPYPHTQITTNLTPSSPKSHLKKMAPKELVRLLRWGRYHLYQLHNRSLIKQQRTAWRQIGVHLSHLNNNEHPIILHPHSHKLASHILPNAPWLSVDTIQSGHSEDGINWIQLGLDQRHPNRPFIDLETIYDHIMDENHEHQLRHSFWQLILQGAAGFSYGAQGLWNMNTMAQPHLIHWGSSTYEQALAFSTAATLAQSKTWLLKHHLWPNLKYLDVTLDTTDSHLETRAISAVSTTNQCIIYFPFTPARQKVNLDLDPIKNPPKAWCYEWVHTQSLKKISSGTLLGKNSLTSFSLVLPPLDTPDALLYLKPKL